MRAPSGARVGAHVCPALVGERVGWSLSVQPKVKEPCLPLWYPRTTNHSLSGVDPEFVLLSVAVSGSSVQLLPLVLLL